YAVVDVEHRLVDVGARLEGHGDAERAGRGRGGAEEAQLLDAGELLLDRRGDGLGERLGARARVRRRHEHGGRRDLRVLRDREQLRRDEARQHDHDGDHAGEDRAVDEEIRHVFVLLKNCSQLADFGWTAVPGRRRTRLSTITLSPAIRPSSTTQSLTTQLPARMLRWAALPCESSTHTKRPVSFCSTALCGTTIAGWLPATICTFTNWPGRICSFEFGNSARICTVPRVASTVEPAKFRRPVEP